MAFITKQFNDLRGILFLMLLTIPSIATTNIDCNGRPFHCVNSTHFMICVDLGSGVSSTIDSFIIPCPAPTECRGTNRFECEFPAVTTQTPTSETLTVTTGQTTTATVQASKSTVRFVPETTTSIPFEDFYNTVSTTTISGSELSTPNPTFITDTTTIDVFDNANVSTSGSHADLEVPGRNINVLNITSTTLHITSETIGSSVATDSSVANTTENAIIFTQTDSNINTINKIKTAQDVISETIGSSVITDSSVANTTENAIILTQTDSNINTITTTLDVISETIGSSVITDSSIANTTVNAIVITQTDNNVNAINKIITANLDVGITTTEENTIPNFTTTERVSLITENVTETDISSVSETQLVTGNINLSNSTQNQVINITDSLKSEIQVDNNTASTIEIGLDQSVIIYDQDQLRTDKANETIVKNPLENVLVNVENTITTSTDIPNDYIVRDAVTKQTSQIYATTETLKASSITIPSDLSISTESIILVEPNTLIENKVVVDHETTSSSGDRGTVDKTLLPIPKTNNEMPIQNATSDNYNLGNVATTSISDTDVITGPSSELHDAVISSTVPTIDTTSNTETIITLDSFYSLKSTNVISTSEVNVPIEAAIANDKNLVDTISTISLPSTDSPSLTTEDKIVNTESTNSETLQNKTVGQSLETNFKTLSENPLTLETTEKAMEFTSTVTELGVSESNINFISNVLNTQPPKLDPASQQLEVSNKPDEDTNVSGTLSQHTILSNIDLSADNRDIKTKEIITEPSLITKNTDNNDVNTRTKLVEYSSIASQPENRTTNIETTLTTESSKDTVSNSFVILQPSVTSLPVLSTESFLYLDTHAPEKATKSQVIIKSTGAGNQLNSQNNDNPDSIANSVTELNRKADQLYTYSDTKIITYTPNEKVPNLSESTTIFVSEVLDSQPSKLDPASQQLEVSNKPDRDINVLDINSQHNKLSNIDLNADNIKTDKSTSATDIYQLNSQNNEKNDSITNDVTRSNMKADQLYTNSETNNIGTTPNEKALNINTIIESTRYEIPTIPPNDETKTQQQEKVEINTLQKTATGTIVYSPTIATGGKLVSSSSEPKIFENDQNIIKQTVEDRIYENRLTLATTESIFELTPTVADFSVGRSTLLLDSTINVQLPKALLTKAIDITNKNNINAPEIGSEWNKLEPKGYEIPMTPMIETQKQLREIEFNSQQQQVPNTISSITRSIAEYDTISMIPVTESTRNVYFDVPSETASPDFILQLTTSSVLENTEKVNSASKVLEYIDSTKNIIENRPDFIMNKDDNSKYYSTGDLTTRSMPTISISGNTYNKVQEYAPQKMASSQDHVSIVNSLENIHYNTNIKLSEGLATLQTPTEPITTESTFVGQINSDKIPNHKNIAAIIANNSVPMFNNTKTLTFKPENDKKPNSQGTSVPILEKTVINLSPSSAVVIQEIKAPHEFQVVTDNTAYGQINQEVQSGAQSANNNDERFKIGTTNIGPTLPQLSSTGDFSLPNTYIAKDIIIKQESPNTTESIPKELNAVVVNEEGRTTADIINQTFTRYSDTKGQIIPADSVTGSDVINKSIGPLNNNTTTKNYSNLVKFNESTRTLVGKNLDQNNNFSVGNDTQLSEAETVQIPNKLEGLSIVRSVKTAPTSTLEISQIVSTTADKTFTPVSNIYNSEKNKVPNYESVLTVTMKSLPIAGGDNTVSKVSGAENKNEAQNIYSSIVSLKDENLNTNKRPEAKVKSLAERDLSITPNKLSTTQVEFMSASSQQVNNNPGEAFNLALFDLLSRAKTGGFEENTNKPSFEKPDDEEKTASENSKINKDRSFTTLSSESVTVTTESVEADNNGNYNNNIIVRSNSKYETLTSKPTIEISTRPTQVDNLKNIQLPIVSEVSTQSTIHSTSQKLSLENNTPLPATTKAITNNFVCKFNQRGRFGDSHDCRKFYICHGRPQPLEGICPIYTVFSELRKQCTKNLSHCVRNNQFQCVSEGRFSDFLNDNIYYICVKNKLSHFIRFRLRCQNGYHLNKTSVRCVLNTESISQSISSDISKSNSEQSAALKLEVKNSKSKDSSTSKKKFECEEEGKFADYDNCRVYYVCKKTSKSGYLRKKKKCDSDENFHKDKKKCVDAESYECK